MALPPNTCHLNPRQHPGSAPAQPGTWLADVEDNVARHLTAHKKVAELDVSEVVLQQLIRQPSYLGAAPNKGWVGNLIRRETSLPCSTFVKVLMADRNLVAVQHYWGAIAAASAPLQAISANCPRPTRSLPRPRAPRRRLPCMARAHNQQLIALHRPFITGYPITCGRNKSAMQAL